MKEDTSDKYTYSLAKNQVCTIIHMRGIRKNVLPGKLYKALYGDAMFEGHKFGLRKPRD